MAKTHEQQAAQANRDAMAAIAGGRAEAALALFARAIELNPGEAAFHANQAMVLNALARPAEAAAAFARARALVPEMALLANNHAQALWQSGARTAAIDAYREAIRLEPTYGLAHNNLGSALQDLGRIDEAAACYAAALDAAPDYAEAHSNLLLAMNYQDGRTAGEIAGAHRQWNRHAPGLARPAMPEISTRLRVGLLSADFRGHSVARFLEPLVAHIDHDAFELFCYSTVRAPDAVTGRLRAHADHWRECLGLDDAGLADRVRADRLHLLVDLMGHSGDNRQGALARRPAPVQATWLGYPTATGLKAMDFRITDAICDPQGAAAITGTEKPLRLERGFLCYAPPADAPNPERRQGPLTFGSFNDLNKIGPAAVAVWAEILTRLPEARLLLKCRQLAFPEAIDDVRRRFADHGIAAERLDLRALIPNAAAHLALYGDIDVALDPTPYNGTTTTCEALWMGVPVVTLAGTTAAGRMGASLLGGLGLDDWVAGDIDAYIATAIALARKPPDRAGLRARVAASPLTDGPGFARAMEEAFGRMINAFV